MIDQIRTRLYQRGDEEQLLALHSKVMNTPWRLDFWRWLYLENPAGEAVVLVAEDRGRIVGHFAYFPLRMQWQGRPFMGSKSVQAIVDPEYQGRGLFTRITRELLQYARKNGVALTYSCPNERSYYPLVHKVGYRNISQTANSSKGHPRGIPILVRPLAPSAIASAMVHHPVLKSFAVLGARTLGPTFWPNRFSSISSINIEEVTTIDERFDALWHAVAKDYPLCTIRDREFLRWRYTQHPEHEYLVLTVSDGDVLRGYLIAWVDELMGLKAGFIVDILSRNQDHAACGALISATLTRFQQLGVEVVAAAMLPYHLYYSALRRKGFFPVPQRWVPKKFFMVVHDNSQGIPREILHVQRNWLVTFGDWDVF